MRHIFSLFALIVIMGQTATAKDLHLKCSAEEILIEDGWFSTKVSVANESTNYRLQVKKNITVNKRQIIVHGGALKGEWFADSSCQIPLEDCRIDIIYSRTKKRESYSRWIALDECWRKSECSYDDDRSLECSVAKGMNNTRENHFLI